MNFARFFTDRYEPRRRDHRGDREDPKEKYKPRRNRWDEKESESGTGNSRSRWDVKEPESRNSRNRWDESERQPNSGHSRSRWNDKTGESSRTSVDSGTRELEHESSINLTRSRERKRSRSRSRSPFRRDFRNYVNPTKDGYPYQSDLSNHSSTSQTAKQDNTSSKKLTSWSDSSDDDNDRSGKSNTFRNPTRSPGQPSQRHYEDYKNNEVPSLDIQASKPVTAERLGSSSTSGISLKLGGSAVVIDAQTFVSISVCELHFKNANFHAFIFVKRFSETNPTAKSNIGPCTCQVNKSCCSF